MYDRAPSLALIAETAGLPVGLSLLAAPGADYVILGVALTASAVQVLNLLRSTIYSAREACMIYDRIGKAVTN